MSIEDNFLGHNRRWDDKPSERRTVDDIYEQHYSSDEEHPLWEFLANSKTIQPPSQDTTEMLDWLESKDDEQVISSDEEILEWLYSDENKTALLELSKEVYDLDLSQFDYEAAKERCAEIRTFYEEGYDEPTFDYDLERMKDAVEQPFFRIPSGMSREELREFIEEQAKKDSSSDLSKFIYSNPAFKVENLLSELGI